MFATAKNKNRIEKCFRQNNISMSSVVGSQFGAMTEAAESRIAHLYSQATPRGKNRNIRHENKILKANDPTPDV
jgi:hypothetical protein